MPSPPRPSDGQAWVTGASSGIGKALALALAREGWTVLASARSEKALRELAAEASGLPGRIVAAPGDVTDADAMERLVAEAEARDGPIALAILNAGIWLPVEMDTFSPEPFAKTFAVNLMGVVNSLTPLVSRMIAGKGGEIAIVSSVAGYGGLPTSAAYGASKAALTNLAESLKLDLAPYGVQMRVVHPGFIDTPATRTNTFPMPFLMPVDDAAARIVAGLKRTAFEITFPRRFTFILKALQKLPYALYFPLVARMTGSSRRG